MGNLKVCKYCKTEIPKEAKVCPNCRKKQKGPLGIIIAVIVALIIIGAVAGGGSDSSSTESSSTDSAAVSSTAEKEVKEEADVVEEITYTAVTKQELSDALQGNAMKAQSTYKDQYLEVTGYLETIDSDGKYISIDAGDDDFSFVNVKCNIKNDDQKAVIMEMNKGDAIVVKGKCTDVGELLGYTIDIDEVTAQ